MYLWSQSPFKAAYIANSSHIPLYNMLNISRIVAATNSWYCILVASGDEELLQHKRQPNKGLPLFILNQGLISVMVSS